MTSLKTAAKETRPAVASRNVSCFLRLRSFRISQTIFFVFLVDTGTPPVIVKEEAEAGEFVAEINKLKAHGGGDCPEYTFKGMLEALYQDPAWGSPMYVFTDAGPKDATEYDIEEVKALASADEYGVTINFFTTGTVS